MQLSDNLDAPDLKSHVVNNMDATDRQLSRQGIVNSYKSIFQGMVRLVRTYKSNIVRLVSFDNSNPIF